jgi:hypothetical protein
MCFFVRVWILFSALLVEAGWVLSAIHQLNRIGYATVFVLAAIVFLFFGKGCLPERSGLKRSREKILRRFKHPAPFLFLVLVILSLLSGSLYEALNWDSNAYRLPRVFHWLWNEQWHWIHTADPRMNIAGCNFEWLAAPLILFSHTDRLLFLINWISYLMLPGLIFSVFTRLQVRRRVAWWWMWLLSSSWCFVFQASSVANDSFGVIYALAAVDLALRTRENKKITDFWLSMLAIALVTGIKQTNIPLVLPWLVAVWPCLPLISRNKMKTVAVASVAMLVSILPVSIFNLEHYGTWLPVEVSGIASIGKFHLNPIWGVVGNFFCIPVQNLLPPFYELLPPFYENTITVWNNWMSAFTTTPFGSHFNSFERFGFLSAIREHGISEGNAGLGLGICVLLFTSTLEVLPFFRAKAVIRRDKFLWVLRATSWLALLVFVAKVGSYENARQLAPYYPLLFPAFLVMAGHAVVVRRRHWQLLGLTTMALTAFLVITLAGRPLFPPRIVLGLLLEKFPKSELVSTEARQYLLSMGQGIKARRDCFRQSLPPDAKVVGYFVGNCDGDEPGLWLPYGQRHVEWILPEDSSEYARSMGIRYMVINTFALPQSGMTLQQWLQKYNASIITEFSFSGDFVIGSPQPDFSGYYLVRLI